MSDIVEELRHWASVAFDSDSEVLDKAAAEIERLRGALTQTSEAWSTGQNTIAQLRVEPEQGIGVAGAFLAPAAEKASDSI